MKVTRRRRQQRKTTKRRKTNRRRKTQKRKGGAPPTIFSPGPYASDRAPIFSKVPSSQRGPGGDPYNPEDEPNAFYEREAASTIKKRVYITEHPGEFKPIQDLLRQYNESYKKTVEAIKQIFHKTQATTANVKELLVNIDKNKDNIHELARILNKLDTKAYQYHAEMAKTPAKSQSLFSRKSKAAPVDTELVKLKEEEEQLYEATNILYHEIEDEIIKIKGIDGFENYNPLIDTPI
jgi:hypothetical protein